MALESAHSIKDLLKSTLDLDLNKIPEHFDKITDPKDKLELIIKLLPYVCPKMSEISGMNDNGSPSFPDKITFNVKDKLN